MTIIRFMVYVLPLVGVLINSHQASAAEFFAKAAVTYTSHSTGGNSTSATSRMIYDIGMYYKFQGAGGWCAGGIYQNEAQGGDLSANRTSYGVSGGWMTPRDSGFYLLASYFVTSTYGDFSGGNGYQADIGYKFTPRKFPLAMQFSYKNYNYSKYDHTDTYIDPYFVVMVDF
ncbi:MAG: hypothetical protein ACM3MG_00300 [Bacillota bacterium]